MIASSSTSRVSAQNHAKIASLRRWMLNPNETDNVRTSAIVGQAGSCVTKLEFADPLAYPADAATVSVSAGGTVHPTVVATCAPAGTLYLIVYGQAAEMHRIPSAQRRPH